MEQQVKQFQRTEDGHLILLSPEERKLLITDLISRIDYGVICMIERVDDFGPRWRKEKLTGFCKQERGKFYFEFAYGLCVGFAEKVLPYLRPLSSMTKEESEEYNRILVESQNCSFEDSESAPTMVNDWLLSKHFDVRGMIQKGLARVAKKGMYETV